MLGQTDPGNQAVETCYLLETPQCLGPKSCQEQARHGADDHIAVGEIQGDGLGADIVLSSLGHSLVLDTSPNLDVRSALGTSRVPSLHQASNLEFSRVLCPSSQIRQQGMVSGHGTNRAPSHPQQVSTSADGTTLDPNAAPFVAIDMVSRAADLEDDLHHVQQVQAGGVGHLDDEVQHLWSAAVTGCSAEDNRITSQTISQEFPFAEVDIIPNISGIAPKDIHKVGHLLNLKVKLPAGEFYDKVLPNTTRRLQVNTVYTPDYFVALHNITSTAGTRPDGSSYAALTPNHIGARMSLPHTKMKLVRWRHHLVGYDQVEICQFLEFGFPVGINQAQDLECQTRNHGSSYMWYTYVDKFITKEVIEGGVTGPFRNSPWGKIVVSPLMTAHKKPNGRRTVFDATFGDLSVNNATPGDIYLGQSTTYTYPKVEDFRVLVLKSGRGAFMWKRDLSRFFLQLPMDPVDYDKVAMVWRGVIFFFVSLAFGLRHSGLNGQRVTDAVAWILRRLGLETDRERAYNVVNYVDDMGGVESTQDSATAAFEALAWLLEDVGLAESKEKAEAPTTQLTYLGVEFDSQAMEMRVPAGKLEEIKSEINLWLRRTTISKKDLQSLLGKLFWVARVVKHARVFLGRMLDQLRSMAGMADNKKVKLLEETRKDILWWATFLVKYNGIEMITDEDPIKLSYQQLLDTPHDICAGDATPVGGGAWHGYEYWCCQLPVELQDPMIPIHVKEFWVLIVSAKLWGETWTGRAMVLYCDNDAVCEVIWKKKPRDQLMLSLLREFLHVVVTKKFYPVIRKISSKENHLADHISRRFDEHAATELFSKSGLPGMVRVTPKGTFFTLTATW